MSTVRLAYWDIRGLAAACRMALTYADVEFENKMYEAKPTGQPGVYDRSGWTTDKANLIEKYPLVNLPYLQDGDWVVSQSNAILSYIGRKWNLDGKTDQEKSKVEQMLCQVMDIRDGAVGHFYSPADVAAARRTNYIAQTKAQFQKLENWLAVHNTRFLAGNDPTVCDFHAWEMLDQHLLLEKTILADFPRLREYYDHIRGLPQLQPYFSGPMFKLPLNNKMASFGNVPL